MMSKEITSKDIKLMPAEWEKQSAIMLTWPHKNTDWLPILDRITETYTELVSKIITEEKIIIVAPDTNIVKRIISSRIHNADQSKIFYFECPTNDTWARDQAFITLRDNEKTYYLDFKFNGWGEKFASDKDNNINKQLFATGILKGEYINHLDFVLEGGSIESDGKGTVFTTTNCLMSPHRNQPLSKNEIENKLKLYLKAKRIVWINHGNLIGDDTDGHIDTLVRIAPNDSILYVSCSDKEDSQYYELKAMEEELTNLRTIEGHPYRLLPLEAPSPIYYEGERLPATYANYLIINGAVIVPTYGQDDKDRKALETIASAFPDRIIKGIDSNNIIIQHGSIHCCTMQLY
ncbi:agmatine deiminase family protein [Xylanibacter oryzae]|uniref:agmatine deiminase family protein n=1 Tax=Xylanibacter oryzae TaxID=185293 RepID=UPI001FE2184F|nr:agmatine deiminase family protein [Xylanibacter oryzae]